VVNYQEKVLYLIVGFKNSEHLSDEEALICGVLLKITHILLKKRLISL